MLDIIIHSLDLLGVSAFSVASTILAHRKRLDLAGTLTVSVIAAIGGGTFRDLLLDRHPIFWLTDLNYLIIIVVSSIIAQFFINSLEKIHFILRTVDAIGLAVFTVIGVEIALKENTLPLIAIIIGAMTATFGGVIRDIVCNEIPLVFQKEIYIVASFLGGFMYIFSKPYLGREYAALICIFFVFILRMLAIHLSWNLPSIWHHVEKNKKK